MSPADSWPPTVFDQIGSQPARLVRVFDPALRHYTRAFRFGGLNEEVPADERSEWSELQLFCSSVVLRSLATSGVGGGLVLRGSWLLRLWFGDRARLPHDLDFVGTDRHLGPDATIDAAHRALVASDTCRAAGLRVDEVTSTSIWTYEKVEGQRLVVPWSVGDHAGAVQVDVTGDEEIPGATDRMVVDDYSISTASIEASLIWKLMWLATDTYPQGKDLFDAVLLSRHVKIGVDGTRWLLRAVFGTDADRTLADLDLRVHPSEWKHFVEEYPAVAGMTSAVASEADLRANLMPGGEGQP